MSPTKSTKGKILRTLIIDDEPDICYLLSTLLKQMNLEVGCVNNLQDAKEVLGKTAHQLIFLDNHLPDGMGTEFISFIRQQHPEVKIIMITAHDTYADRQYALEEGADMFIPKPFTRDTIFNAIDQTLTKQFNTHM
jgi:DNA-binding response OmpR family regulator